jgi:hypothetical protein
MKLSSTNTYGVALRPSFGQLPQPPKVHPSADHPITAYLKAWEKVPVDPTWAAVNQQALVAPLSPQALQQEEVRKTVDAYNANRLPPNPSGNLYLAVRKQYQGI